MQIIQGSVKCGSMICRLGGQFRTNKMATIPQNRIPFAEKAAHGVVMFLGLLAVPCYIMCNLKNYRGDSK
ncbi:hypothetical protein HCN44_008440 [Aphidius gifuensis]|uniref:Uncharacterized protein n=1 Tax=Aphidius gifuensis TaxID=684658 RepID=A0A834XPH3_APHGI|nr:hypothetical protein HCN44_008440 [Aphidius gifuensis]